MSTISSFKTIKNKFCESLREHAMEINNIKKKKMKLLINEGPKQYQNTKVCYICNEIVEDKHAKVKNIITDHCHYTEQYRGAAQSICNLKYSIPKEIPVVFYNGCNYDYRFIIKELAEEF